MAQTLSTRQNLHRMFYYLTLLYEDKKYPHLKAVYQFILKQEGNTHHFYLVINGSRIQFKEGVHPEPDITLSAPAGYFFKILSNRANPVLGLLLKKYSFTGRFDLLPLLKKLFNIGKYNPHIQKINENLEPHELLRNTSWKKPEQVLVIHASPSRRTGLTFHYLQSLVQGMRKAGAQSRIIDLYDPKIRIEPCTGCFQCWTRTGGKCVIKDDAYAITEKIKKSYLTLYTMSLYVDSMPAKLKSLLERKFTWLLPVFSVHTKITRHPLRFSKERYMALFMINGFPEKEHFKPLVDTFRDAARNFHTPIRAVLLRPGATFLYQVPLYYDCYLKVLSSLEQAGWELVQKGSVSKKTVDAVADNFRIPRQIWCDYANMFFYIKSRHKE
ncbi:MAG: NAD(P)H-dependent oxidoreductase [bacterium]|nr:NAD(P)H-dependent oxidoreductase [bacterium]